MAQTRRLRMQNEKAHGTKSAEVFALLFFAGKLAVPKASHQMIVHHSDRLHERVALSLIHI